MIILIHIIAFLVAVFILVLAHEFGHFIVALKLGIKVDQFSIGFGKSLLKWRSKKSDIEYIIAPILLGGYVKMNDESYNKASVWRRMAIMLAGVFANVILAIILFWLMYSIGIVLPKPVIGKITNNSIAYHAGLKAGTEIKKIDNKKINNWQDASIAIISRLGDRDYMLINKHKLDLSNWQVAKFNPNPIKSLGIEPYIPDVIPIINKVMPNSPAALMGLKARDHILFINDYKIESWNEAIKYLQQYPKQKINLTIRRNNKKISLSGVTGSKFGPGWKKIGYLGILSLPAKWSKDMLIKEKYAVWKAIVPAVGQVGLFLKFNFIVIMKMISGKISLHVLGGPLTILSAATEALQQGFVIYIGFLGLLSVMLAFINILPIPILDGGNFILLLIEAIRKKPISAKKQLIAMRIGMLILALLIFIAIGNDLLRIFY